MLLKLNNGCSPSQGEQVSILGTSEGPSVAHWGAFRSFHYPILFSNLASLHQPGSKVILIRQNNRQIFSFKCQAVGVGGSLDDSCPEHWLPILKWKTSIFYFNVTAYITYPVLPKNSYIYLLLSIHIWQLFSWLNIQFLVQNKAWNSSFLCSINQNYQPQDI